jgi:hypothetical protein
VCSHVSTLPLSALLGWQFSDTTTGLSGTDHGFGRSMTIQAAVVLVVEI